MTRDSAATLLRAHRELPTINETVVDGVPTFWVDEGGPFMASLIFRVGVADEILATRGITHLVEHLALSQVRDVAHQFNGSVGLDITSFWATGAVADVCDFLPRLGAALAALPLQRLDLEAGVLIAEQAGRAGSSLEYLLERRFGPHGPGVAAHPEYGLLRLTGAAVQQWARDRFTADNAVLVLNGRPPESLRLGLPRGTRHQLVLPPDGYSFEMTGPTRVESQDAGLAVGTFGRRSTPLVVAAQIVASRATEVLRHELGRVYGINHEYVHLTADEAFLYWGTDCAPEHTAEVTQAFGGILDDLATTGPTADELAKQIAVYEQVFAIDRAAVAGDLAHRQAVAELRGHIKPSYGKIMVEMYEATPHDLAEALSDAMARAMCIATDAVDIGFSWPEWLRDGPVPGRAIRAKHDGTVRRYVLGDEALGSVIDGEWVTVRFDELEIVQHFANGGRMLIDRRGWWLAVPAGGRRLQRLITAIDERAPRHVVAPAARA